MSAHGHLFYHAADPLGVFCAVNAIRLHICKLEPAALEGLLRQFIGTTAISLPILLDCLVKIADAHCTGHAEGGRKRTVWGRGARPPAPDTLCAAGAVLYSSEFTSSHMALTITFMLEELDREINLA